MKYFAIEHSMDKKVLGKVEQTKGNYHNCHIWDEPRFIDRFAFKKIEINPILSYPILHQSAKLTDLIKAQGIGLTPVSIIISNKFKRLLEKFNLFGVQFFPTFVIQNNKKISGYWQSHIYDIPYNFIDFDKTNIMSQNIEKMIINFKEILPISTSTELVKAIEKMQYPSAVYIDNPSFTSSMILDYFCLRYFDNGGYYGTISQKLKLEIENQGITGIEFRPIEISYQDWLHYEREKIYGKL